MNDSNIDELLRKHRAPTPKRQLKTNFTQTIVAELKAAPKRPGLRAKLEELHMKFNRLPRLAAIAIIIGSTGTFGCAAYAAYQWITPKVEVTQVIPQNDDNKRQFTVSAECGDFYSGKALSYELSPSAKMSDDDVGKVFKNTCEYDAFKKFITGRWVSNTNVDKMKAGDTVTLYQSDNVFAGSTKANPVFGLTLGRVTSIDATKVTYSLPLYYVDQSLDETQPMVYYPQGKEFSRTLPLDAAVQVWQDGEQIRFADVKIGDLIQVVAAEKHKVQYYEDIKQNALGEQLSFSVVGIIKTNVNPAYIAGSPTGNPAIVNALAKLSPCTGNSSYSCIALPNQRLGSIYAVEPGTKGGQNQKYLRKDFSKIESYELDGRIKAINGTRVALETRGNKKIFTVDLPYDAIAAYNQKSTPKVAVGDMIQVYYNQTKKEDHLSVKPGDVVAFMLYTYTLPDGSAVKY